LRTFSAINEEGDLYLKLNELARRLANELEEGNLQVVYNFNFQGKTVSLKLKKTNFEVLIRSKTLKVDIFTAEDLFIYAKEVIL
jgi:hypothetical protein